LGNLIFVDLDLVSKELILLDKLLLQVRQTVVLLCQAGRLVGGLQELLGLLVEGSEALGLLLQVHHLLLSVLLLLFDGNLSMLHFLHGHTPCGQSLP